MEKKPIALTNNKTPTMEIKPTLYKHELFRDNYFTDIVRMWASHGMVEYLMYFQNQMKDNSPWRGKKMK